MTLIDQHKDLIKKLYANGFVSQTAFNHNEIYKYYLNCGSVTETAGEFEITRKHVHTIINKFKAM
jgi:hypothetical protein